MKRLLVVAVAALSGLTLAANASAGRSLVDVKTNARGGLLTGPTLAVIVRPHGRLTSFRAWIDITDVTSQFGVQAGIRAATLSRTDLVPGVHHLYVETSGAKGARDFDTVRFVVGSVAENLLGVGDLGPVGGEPVLPRVNLADRGATLRAWLNGHSVTRSFTGPGASVRSARLGANDGVRFGRNTLRLVGFHPNGAYDVDTIRFTVPRTHPLAGAGPDRHGTVGGLVRLDGTSSKATTGRARLHFSWRIVARPRGSKARLRDAHGARPFFYPDVNGRYRIRLSVSQRGLPPGLDVVDPEVVPPDPPIGVRIDTLGTDGQVVIDGKPVAKTGGAGRVSLVVLSRYSRAVKTSNSFPGTKAGIADLKTAMTPGGQGYQNLVIVSGRGVQADAAADLAAALGTVGARLDTTDQVRIGAGTPFSVVGVPGSPDGSAYTNVGRGSAPGNLGGYLQVNLSNPATTQYGFVFQDFVPFSTHRNVNVPDGYANDITVGGKVYESGAVFLLGQSGFQVLDLDGATLEPRANRTFVTTTVFAQRDEEQQRAMADFLSQIPPGDVVFVQSIPPGSPLGEGPLDPWTDISNQIEAFGGNRAVFNSLYPVYGLAGTRRAVRPGVAPGVEVYDSDNDSGASATGFLVRNHSGLFEPESADLTAGLPNAELVRYASQPAQPWPDSTTAGQKAANDWITRQLKLLGRCGDPSVLCDMRAQYYLNFNAAWGSIFGQLQALKFPKGEKGFSQADFQAVKRDFVQEIPMVDRVSQYIGNLQEPFNRAEGRGHVDLGKIALAIQADLQVAPESASTSNALTMTGYILALGKFIPDVGPFFTAASAGFALAGYLTRPNGAGTWATIDAKVSEVSDELTARFDAFHGELVQLGRVLVSDPGKLQAVASRVYSDGWRLDGSYQRMLDGLTKASQTFMYTALMPVPWWLWRLETYGNVINKANEWFCTTDRHEGAHIYMFNQVTDSGQEIHTISFPRGVPFGQVSVLAPQFVDWAQDRENRPPHPAAEVTDPLFLPVDGPNPRALGLDKRYFYSPFVFKTHTALNYFDQCDHVPAAS